MDARNNIAEDLFYKIRSRFSGLKLGEETGQITINPEEARFFDFDYMEGKTPIGHVSISLAEPNSMKVYFSHGITEGMDDGQKDNWYSFLRELRQFAKRRLLSFDTRDIAKDNLDKRDYEFLVQNSQPKPTTNNTIQKPVGESIMAESNMYGSKLMSYQNLLDTRLIIKHNQAVMDDAAPGARTRHISALFVENQDGERFKYPFIHLAGARAMQRHVANGGVPYDDIGKSIVRMSEEIAALKSFGGYVVRNDLMNSETNNVVERSSAYLNSLREQVKALAKQSHYEAYRENFQAVDSEEVPQDVVEDFKEKFTVRSFKEDIASVFPVLYRLMKEGNTIGYDDIVALTQEDIATEDVQERETLDPFAKFENWVMGLGEDSAITSQDPEEQQAAIQGLQELVAQPFPAGVDGTNAIESLQGLIEDPELYRRIKGIASQDANADVREQVQGWLQLNAPEVLEQLDFGDLQMAAAQEGIEEAGDQPPAPIDQPPTDPKKKRLWMQWWKDHGKNPEDFGVKPNANAGKPFPKWQKVPRPNARGDWDADYVFDNPDEKAAWDKNDKDYYAQPEYKAFDADRSAHFKDMEKAKKAHYAKQGSFDLQMTIGNPFFDPKSTDPEDEDTPEEIDVGIDYNISGDYRPATWGYHGGDPEEYPEIEIMRVVDLDTGEEITDELDSDQVSNIEQRIADGEGDRMTSTAKDYWRRNREPDESADPQQQGQKGGMNVNELAEFITSFYDKESNSFPKGPEGVCTMVGKKFGEQAEAVARKFVERMAPHQSTEQNPELAELARIKQLSGMR